MSSTVTRIWSASWRSSGRPGACVPRETAGRVPGEWAESARAGVGAAVEAAGGDIVGHGRGHEAADGLSGPDAPANVGGADWDQRAGDTVGEDAVKALGADHLAKGPQVRVAHAGTGQKNNGGEGQDVREPAPSVKEGQIVIAREEEEVGARLARCPAAVRLRRTLAEAAGGAEGFSKVFERENRVGRLGAGDLDV